MSNQSLKRARTKSAAPTRRSFGSATWAALFAGGLLLAGCGGTVIREGHLFHDEDIAQIHPGMGKIKWSSLWAIPTPGPRQAASLLIHLPNR